MDWNQIFAAPGFNWLILAGILAIAELVVPGVFLIFIAAGAAVAGLATLAMPALGWPWQVLLFLVAASAAVAIGRRVYRDMPVPSADPLLNHRTARLIGEIVTVVAPIEAGRGRVRVGDGEWPAEGPDAPAGARVRIVAAHGTALSVEPA